jgi:hypothetical protein
VIGLTAASLTESILQPHWSLLHLFIFFHGTNANKVLGSIWRHTQNRSSAHTTRVSVLGKEPHENESSKSILRLTINPGVMWALFAATVQNRTRNQRTSLAIRKIVSQQAPLELLRIPGSILVLPRGYRNGYRMLDINGLRAKVTSYGNGRAKGVCWLLKCDNSLN